MNEIEALRAALEYLEGARFENYSGQIIAHHTNKNAVRRTEALITIAAGAGEAEVFPALGHWR